MGLFSNDNECDKCQLATALYRECREVLFKKVMKSYPPERESEDEETCRMRDENNRRNKKAWDRETELMLEGKLSFRICETEFELFKRLR